MKRTKYIILEVVLALVLSGLVLTLSFMVFMKNFRSTVLDGSRTILEDNSVYYTELIQKTFEARLRYVKSVALLLEDANSTEYSSMTKQLDTLEMNTILDDVYLIDTEGNRKFTDGRVWNLSGQEVFTKGMSDESGITTMIDPVTHSGQCCVCYYTPLYLDDRIAGVLVACNYYENLLKILDAWENVDNIRTYLVNQEGEVLLCDKGEPDFNLMLGMKAKLSEDDYNSFVENLKGNKTAGYRYKGSKGTGLISISSLNINDWHVVKIFLSGGANQLVEKLNGSAYMLAVGILLSMAINIAFMCHISWSNYNRKTSLMEISMDALNEAYPRIAKINCSTNECVFIKDSEDTLPRFSTYDWESFRVDFMKTVHPEEAEKWRAFSSLENFRRVIELGETSDTCVYRRTYRNEYQWMQAVVIPMKREKYPNCVLVYARNVDDSIKAEEFHKKQLGVLLHKAKNAEQVKNEYLKYVFNDLKTPIDALIDMNALAENAMKNGKDSLAAGCSRSVDILGRYVMTQLNDMIQIGVQKEQRLISKRNVFSLYKTLEGCRYYYNNVFQKNQKELFHVLIDPLLETEYLGDEIRLIQVLNALISTLCLYNSENRNVTIEVTLEKRTDEYDNIIFRGRDDNEQFDMEFRENLQFFFPKFLIEQEDGKTEETTESEEILYPAKMALEALRGSISIDETKPYNNFCATIRLERVTKDVLAAEPLRILLVDDNEFTLGMEREILEFEGSMVTACNNADEALFCYDNSTQGSYDYVLTDAKMPQMSGFELAAKIHQKKQSNDKQIRVIIISSSTITEAEKNKYKGIVDGYLEKPLRYEELMGIIYQDKRA